MSSPLEYEYRVIDEEDIEFMEREGWVAVAKENFRGSNVFHPFKAPEKKRKILMRVPAGPKF